MENSGVSSGPSSDRNESRLNTSDAPNEVNTELRASRVCSRLPVSSASSDEQAGRLLKERVTAMHERKNPTFHMINAYATKGGLCGNGLNIIACCEEVYISFPSPVRASPPLAVLARYSLNDEPERRVLKRF
eukprot:scaffold3742_cov74-Phaeocystis_antarctica.AAC.4